MLEHVRVLTSTTEKSADEIMAETGATPQQVYDDEKMTILKDGKSIDERVQHELQAIAKAEAAVNSIVCPTSQSTQSQQDAPERPQQAFRS
jgi:hypothetical protein